MENCDEPKLPKYLYDAKPLKLEDLKFLFSQVEKRVKETADEGDRLNTRSITVIGVCITFLTGLFGWIITNFHKEPYPIILTAIYLFFHLFRCVSILKPNIHFSRYLSIGSYPSDLLKDNMFKLTEGQTVEYKILYSELISYEKRVRINVCKNEQRSKALHTTYSWLYSVVIYVPICYLCLAALFFYFG
jgi:hypothetical protein